MARAALVVWFIIVRCDINNRAGFDAQCAIFEKIRIFFPSVDLYLAGDINGPAPAAAAQRSLDNLVDSHFLTIDLNHLFNLWRDYLSARGLIWT